MKSQILKNGDRVLITQDFIDNIVKRGMAFSSVWKLDDTAKVCETTDYSQVRIYRGIWSIWIDNDLAESMYAAYEDSLKVR